jgi:hypothetical protein
MRSLVQDVNGNYTEAQLNAQLVVPSAAAGCRIDVLDSQLNLISGVPTINAETCQVDFAAGRDIPMSCTLTMLPNTVVNVPFLYRVRPWFRLRMPDGGIAEWPMGVYVWGVPDRIDCGSSREIWQATLGDQTHILQLAGPGLLGFTVAKGTQLTSVIVGILNSLGMDPSGVIPSTVTTSTSLGWGLTTRKSVTPTTWLHILKMLHKMLGYQPPWFDLSGLYRAQSQVDFTAASPAKKYVEGAAGAIVTPVSSNQDLTHFANRVICKAHSAKGVYTTAISDLNTRYAGHLMSQNSIGFYIDAVIVNHVGSSVSELQVAADAELDRRMARYQSINFASLAYPGHECNDLIGLALNNDSQYAGDGITGLETAWSMDLVTGTMTHDIERITP